MNKKFEQYQRTNIAEMRPYEQGEDLTAVSVSKEDHPETDMGMIARNPENHNDQWYVARKYFEENFKKSTSLTSTPESSGIEYMNAVPDKNGNYFIRKFKKDNPSERWIEFLNLDEIDKKERVIQFPIAAVKKEILEVSIEERNSRI